MSSLSPKDRVSLCTFTFADGRRCRSPQVPNVHPRARNSVRGTPGLCHHHSQKESRAVTANKLANDLASFFSGYYISANDLSSALARLMPAVVRGDIKPRTARTVAYMAQTLLQSIHFSQSEFTDAFGSDGLRKAIRSGITSNRDRLFPPAQPSAPAPAPTPAQPASTQPQPEPPQPESQLQTSQPQPTLQNAALAQPPTPVVVSTPPQPPTAQAQSPSPAEPTPPAAPPSGQAPTPARRRPPERDPYAVHFDHNYTLQGFIKPL